MKLPEIIVRYLPQFHQIPENDEWWGEGFTEWTTVKKAEPLFEGHMQPRVPLNGYYYDLMHKSTMEWQANLAQKYHIDGFAFYHYYFKGDRKLLEKPAENLLKWRNIDMPFCFCWANQTWARTWSKLSDANPWSKMLEGQEQKIGNGILLEQKYGGCNEWIEHIKYLLPFFKDKRYLKNDNKPVFIILKPDHIRCLPDMLECWSDFLKGNGIPGIYLIGEAYDNTQPETYGVDARMIRLPDCVIFRQMRPKLMDNGLKAYDYDEYFQKAVTYDWTWKAGKPTYLCVANDYDDTPRHGNNGNLLLGASVDKFKKYFKEALDVSINMQADYIFINAWNEWGEGMYLEPDTKNGYGYLEAIYDAVEVCEAEEHRPTGSEKVSTGGNDDLIEIAACGEKKSQLCPKYINEIERLRKSNKILKLNLQRMTEWLSLYKRKTPIVEYLLRFGIKRIAVYGGGYMGKALITDLEQSAIKIAYVIDKNTKISNKHPVYQLDADLPSVDAIVVTPNGQYEEIRQEIKKYVQYPTIALEHILFELS